MSEKSHKKPTSAYERWCESTHYFRTALEPYQANHDFTNLALALKLAHKQAEDTVQQFFAP